MCAHLHVRLDKCTYYVCIYIHTHIYVYVCIHIYVHTYICIHIEICTYIYIYTRKWICIVAWLQYSFVASDSGGCEPLPTLCSRPGNLHLLQGYCVVSMGVCLFRCCSNVSAPWGVKNVDWRLAACCCRLQEHHACASHSTIRKFLDALTEPIWKLTQKLAPLRTRTRSSLCVTRITAASATSWQPHGGELCDGGWLAALCGVHGGRACWRLWCLES